MTTKSSSTPSKYDEAIDKSLEFARVYDREGYPYVVHPLMDGVPRADPLLLQAWLEWALSNKDLLSKATVLLAPEAMALPLVAPLSIATGIPYVVIRKRKYGLPGEVVAYCETGYGESSLHINDVSPQDRVLLIDDVYSTGGTLSGLFGALDDMQVPIVGALIFIDKGQGRAEFEKTSGTPIRVMRRISIELGKVRILR